MLRVFLNCPTTRELPCLIPSGHKSSKNLGFFSATASNVRPGGGRTPEAPYRGIRYNRVTTEELTSGDVHGYPGVNLSLRINDAGIPMDDRSLDQSLCDDFDSPDDPRLSLLRGLSAGEDGAYAEFWRFYGDRLRALAHSRLPAFLQNRLGADDVVQSACRSFFRRVSGGELKLSDSENLWRLLCAMTLNKVRMQIRYHSRQRRSPRREVPLDAPADSSTTPHIQPAMPNSSPEELVMFAEQLEQLMSALSEEERRMVELKLQDYSSEEIASRLGCSERTVRRLLQRVRERWQTYLQESLGADPAS